MLERITRYIPKRYRKIIKWSYDIFLIALFVGMAYYCANTNCYEVTDEFGNPIPKEEIRKILQRYVNEYNKGQQYIWENISFPNQIANYPNYTDRNQSQDVDVGLAELTR